MESKIDSLIAQLKEAGLFGYGDITMQLQDMDVMVRDNGKVLHIRASPDGARRYAIAYMYNRGKHYFPIQKITEDKVVVMLESLLLFLATAGRTPETMSTFLGLLSGRIPVRDVAPSLGESSFITAVQGKYHPEGIRSTLIPPKSPDIGRGLTDCSIIALHLEQYHEFVGNDIFSKAIYPASEKAADRPAVTKGPTGYLRQGSSKRKSFMMELMKESEVYRELDASLKRHRETQARETRPPLPSLEILRSRHEFDGVEEYIVYLETLIGLPHPPSHATLHLYGIEHLEPDPGFNLQDPFAGQIQDGHYIPKEDEPSPFIYLCNWVEWKRVQPGWDNYKGSYSPIIEQLFELLRAEKYRSMIDRENVPFGTSLICAGLAFPTLGMVIHRRYNYNVDWEEAHRIEQTKVVNNHPR